MTREKGEKNGDELGILLYRLWSFVVRTKDKVRRSERPAIVDALYKHL